MFKISKPHLSLALLATALMAVAPVKAQQTTTTTANGSDFWNGSTPPELYQLHENGGARTCSGSEVFVTVRGALGYCMDANENAAGSLQWEDAREICMAAGKRLPEPAEYKFACDAGVPGLNNMTDDAEWASNFAAVYRSPVTGTPVVLYAPGMGNGACNDIFTTSIATSSSSNATAPFRCVR